MSYSPGHNVLKMVQSSQLAPIQTILSITINHIQTTSPSTYKVLQFLSILAPGGVPRALLDQWAITNDATSTLDRSLTILKQVGLITTEDVAAQINTQGHIVGPFLSHIQLHATVLKYVRTMIKLDDDARHLIALQVHDMLLDIHSQVDEMI
jgi:hypothetical protein